MTEANKAWYFRIKYGVIPRPQVARKESCLVVATKMIIFRLIVVPSDQPSKLMTASASVVLLVRLLVRQECNNGN